MTALDRLITQLSRMPGVGKKSAGRMAYYILAQDRGFARALADEIGSLHDRIRPCSVCGNYTEGELCGVCADPRRDRAAICVVEHPQDVAVLEASGEYHGTYHVLGGVIAPIDGVGPEQLNIASLHRRVEKENTRELIIATNPTVDGDATALYIARLFAERGIAITRLALGLPVGGDLEYADRLTIARSLRGRVPLG